MKKFLLYGFIGMLGLIASTLGFQVLNAQTYGVADTSTFILDKGNDLGKIIPKGVYFTPRIEYTDTEAVKQQLLDNLYYPGDFYTKRNITPQLVEGESEYFFIDWKAAYKIGSLSGIKRVLNGYLFAYRKNGEIYWMDAKDFTPAFLTGYKDPKDQSIIIYPIKNKQTKKIVAFLQYPCGNLVCRDSMCTDLKVIPKCGDGITNYSVGEQCDPKDPDTRKGCTNQCVYEQLNCEIKNSKEEVYNTSNLSVKVSKDSNVDIKSYFLDREEYEDLSDLNKQKLEPGLYQLNATAVNKYTGKEFSCESTTFRVVGKEMCGDGIMNGVEECDYKDPLNNGSCSTSCKLLADSCSITAKTTKLTSPTLFKDAVTLKKSDTTNISRVYVNGNTINPDNYRFDTDGKYVIKYDIVNNFTKKTSSCQREITYDKKEFCGDGKVNGYEQCDDGDTVDGDGCSKSCKYENPSCSFIKDGTTFQEGKTFDNYLDLKYSGRFNNIVLNKNNTYNSESSFLNSTIQRSECGDSNSLEMIVSNPINSSITKTCSTTFKIKNTEFCGDGIVQKNEQCDPKDYVSGKFCTNSCTFKPPVDCNIMQSDFKVGVNGSVIIDTDYYAHPVKAVMDGKSYTAKNGIFNLKFNKSGVYDMKVYIGNKLDTKLVSPKICDVKVVVEDNMCK